jgi:flagellar biosynthesis protein FliR
LISAFLSFLLSALLKNENGIQGKCTITINVTREITNGFVLTLVATFLFDRRQKILKFSSNITL